MTRICNFPIAQDRRCKHHVADGKPNCGRHSTELSADQLGQNPTIYEKDGELHVWAGQPNDFYCLIHGDPAYRVLCQLAKEVPPCCLRKTISWTDEHGGLHRDGGPALIEPDGTQYWYQHNKFHRDDGPAIIESDGTQHWYQYGEQHRDDGPAIVHTNGRQMWFRHGEVHRDDGPAIIDENGTQWWYQHNSKHRDDGPAAIGANGAQAWFWHGTEVTEQEHARLRKRSLGT